MGFKNTNASSKVNSAFGQNQYAFGDKKPVQYKSPTTFDFNISDNNGGFDFSTFTSTKAETKEMPFSPSTQPQINMPSKPIIKGTNESGSKKFIGPPPGGIKKPPKYN